MQNDPIVEEMRANGWIFAAEYDNDIGRICEALRQKQKMSKRKMVSREPKRLHKRAVS
jgi:hypothetical protein